MKAGKQAESGQIIIETILLLMVLLAVIFAFVEVCLIAVDKHEVDRIARYAARAWSVRLKWDAQTALSSATILRTSFAASKFDQLQKQIGQVRETSRVDPTDGTGRSGLEFRTFIPVLMPFTEEFVGWQVDPPDGNLLTDPSWAPITPAEIQALTSFGVRRVVRSITFIPIDREPTEDPSQYDNDFNDD